MSPPDYGAQGGMVSPRTPGSAISSHRSPRPLSTNTQGGNPSSALQSAGSFYRSRPAGIPAAELSPRTHNSGRRSARSPNDNNNDALSSFPAVAEMESKSNRADGLPEAGYLDRKVTSLEGEIETLTTLLHRANREREAEMEVANARWQAKLLAMQATHESEVATLRSRLEAKLQDTLVTNKTSAATSMRVAQNRIRALELELADMKASAERASVEAKVLQKDELDSAVLERVTAAVYDVKTAAAAEKAVLERRHADECAFLRRVHAEEVESVRFRLEEASQVNLLAAQVRAVTKTVEEVQQRLDGEASSVVTVRMAHLDARERLLLDVEAKMKAAASHAEDEAHRLQSLLATVETSMSGQRKQLDDDRARLEAENGRLTAWQAVISNEVENTRNGALTERQQLQALRHDLEQERRNAMSEVATMYREAQAAKDESFRLKSDFLPVHDIERLQSDSRNELAATRAAIDAARLDLSTLQATRDTVASEVRKLQSELALSSGEKAALEAMRAQREAEAAQAAEQVATARRLHEESVSNRQQAEQMRLEAENARKHAAQLEASATAERERAELTIRGLTEERRNLVEERAAISRERQQLMGAKNRSNVQVPQLPTTMSSVGAAAKLATMLGSQEFDAIDARVAPLQPRNSNILNTSNWSARKGLEASATVPIPVSTDRSSMRQMLAEWQQDSAKATQALLADHDKLMNNVANNRGIVVAPPSTEDTGAPSSSLVPRSTSVDYSAQQSFVAGGTTRGEEGIRGIQRP